MNGLKLKTIRKEKKWTLKQVALMMNLSISYIHDLETGRRKPSYEVLKKLESVFKIDYKTLFEEEKSPHENTDH